MEAAPRGRWRSPAGVQLLAWGLALQLQGGALGDPAALTGHSVKQPPDIRSLANEWYLGGTMIPSERSLVISPGVPGRMGVMWSMYPLLTADFEVTMTFQAHSLLPAGSKPTVADDGFAFWYVYENATEAQAALVFEHVQNQQEMIDSTWSSHVLSKGFDLFGYRSQYDGLGVFFLDDEQQPTVSALMNNGKMPYKLRMGVPTADALKFDWRSNQEVTVKIRVQPAAAKVDIVGGGSVEVKADFKAGGYIGISLMSGNRPGGYQPQERSTYVELKSLEVMNHDTGARGEEAHELKPAAARGEKEDILAGSSSFRDFRAESDAIKDLTNMVFKLVTESQPQRQQMVRAIETLAKRVTVMETTFKQLKVELDKKTGHKLTEEFDAIKKELTSLSTYTSKETEARHKRLETLHTDLADAHQSAHSSEGIDKHLDRLTESNSKVLSQLTSEHQKMFGVSIAAIAFIMIAGLSLYNKFRCWEKKHIL